MKLMNCLLMGFLVVTGPVSAMGVGAHASVSAHAVAEAPHVSESVHEAVAEEAHPNVAESTAIRAATTGHVAPVQATTPASGAADDGISEEAFDSIMVGVAVLVGGMLIAAAMYFNSKEGS